MTLPPRNVNAVNQAAAITAGIRAEPIDSRTAFGRMSNAAKSYVYVVCITALFVIVRAVLTIGPTPPFSFAPLLLLSLLASLVKIEILVPYGGSTLTVCHVIDFMALITCGPQAAVLVAAWGGWTQCTFRSRLPNPAHQTAFSVASLALAMELSGTLYEWLGGQTLGRSAFAHWEPFAAAAGLFFVLNSGFVAGAVALTTAQPFLRIWMNFFLSTWPSYVFGMGLAVAATVGIQQRAYWLVPILAASLALIHRNHTLVLERLHDAVTDPLTGLPNQRYISDNVAGELRKARRTQRSVALVVLDLDGFKEINDRAGHAAGDAVLRRVAKSLKRSIYSSETCGRYGGDEFVLVMPDCGAREAVRRVEAIQAAVRVSQSDSPGPAGALTFSAGVAVYPDDGDHFDALFAAADSRMYRSKFQRRRTDRVSVSA